MGRAKKGQTDNFAKHREPHRHLGREEVRLFRRYLKSQQRYRTYRIQRNPSPADIRLLSKERILFAKMPLPIERGLAESFQHAWENEIVTFDDLYYPYLVHFIVGPHFPKGHEIATEGAAVWDGESKTKVRQQFLQELTRVQQQVDENVHAGCVKVGARIEVESFPLGGSFQRVIPLIDGKWLDRRLLELVLWWELLIEQGFAFRASLDLNPAAFEQVLCDYAAETGEHYRSGENRSVEKRKKLEQASNEHLAKFRQRASKHLSRLKAAHKTINGIPHVCIDHAATWDDRFVKNIRLIEKVRCPPHEDQETRGVVLESWNSWIRRAKPTVLVTNRRVPLCELPNTHVFPGPGDVVPIDNPIDLQERLRARRELLDGLIAAAREGMHRPYFEKMGLPRPTDLQVCIFRVLLRGPLPKEALAKAVGCHPRTLHKTGGIEVLLDKKIVANDREHGGYYLTEFPSLISPLLRKQQTSRCRRKRR